MRTGKSKASATLPFTTRLIEKGLTDKAEIVHTEAVVEHLIYGEGREYHRGDLQVIAQLRMWQKRFARTPNHENQVEVRKLELAVDMRLTDAGISAIE